MPRILLSIFVVLAVTFAAVRYSTAFFSDTETSTNNVFAAGKLDLKIGNHSYYNGQESLNTTWDLKDLTSELFFNFNDVKPGDLGEDTIGIKVDDNDAWACANVKITKDEDNVVTQPEITAGDNPDDLKGELGQHLYFVLWNDDGDNVLETEEHIITQGTASGVLNVTWPIADSQINTVGEPQGHPLTGGKTYHIGKAWCFGKMTIAPVPQDGVAVRTPIGPEGSGFSCDGSQESNITQTDVLMGDITFSAVQARNNPNFVCGQAAPACTPVYGASFSNVHQGTLKNGSPITDPLRTDPSKALGPPDGIYTPVPSNFFSLGKGGTITLAFASPISNILGYDMRINFYEITGGRPTYPEEKAKVEVSQDGSTFVPVVTEASSLPTGITNIDFSATGLPAIQYVRLTDDTNFTPHADTADGYDLDAIQGNCKVVRPE
jgi:hypothetical protein